MTNFDPEDWVDLEAEADSEPDVEPPSELEVVPDGELVGMLSSSNREAVTMQGVTFKHVLLNYNLHSFLRSLHK